MGDESEHGANLQERQRLGELLAEYNAILDQEPVLVSGLDSTTERPVAIAG